MNLPLYLLIINIYSVILRSLIPLIAWLWQDIAPCQGNFVPLPGKKRYVGRKDSPGLSFRFDHPSRPVIRGRFARKNPTLAFTLHSSLFTKQAEPPINTRGVGGEECTATLHRSSPLFTYRKAPLFFLPRSGHHLCQGLVIIDAKAWSS